MDAVDETTPSPTTAPGAQERPRGQGAAVVRELLRPHLRTLLFGCLLTVASGALGLAQPLAAREVLEALAVDDSLTKPIVLLCGSVLLAAIALGFGNYFLLRASEDVVLDGRRSLISHILRLRLGAFRALQPGDLMSRVTADTTLLRQVAIQAVAQGLLGGVLLIGAIVLMAIVDLVLLATVIGVVVVLGVVMGVVLPRIRVAALAAQGSVGEMGAAMERALGAFTTVKASGTESAEIERIGDAARRARDQGVGLAKWSAIAGTGGGLAVQVAFLVVLGVGGARVSTGAIDVATLVAFLLYVFYLTQPILQLVNAATYFQAGRAALGRIVEVRTMETEPEAAPGPAVPRATRPAALRFEGVRFAHAGADREALAGIDLEVPGGGMTALVGPSGAGKSTMLALVERFYEPTEGRILLDGRDLREIPLADLRASIAYVEQDAPVLAGSLRDNLTYAAPGATDAEVREVIERCRLDALLQRLGGDLDADVGYRGTAVSGGERQRIAIARSLLRRPRILLLDEVTSQLDAVNERALREVVRQVSEEVTVVAVAHRLSTITAARQIAVLEDGKVRATGTHDALMDADELYASFVHGQLLGGDRLGPPLRPTPAAETAEVAS